MDKDERERERLTRVAENRNSAAPIVADLVKAGFPIQSIADLFDKGLDYHAAVPILLDWLPRVSNRDVKEDIVRALSVKWAKPHAARALISEFHRAQDTSGDDIRWAIGNALEVVADDSVFDELVEIVQDRRCGRARQMVAVALGNVKRPEAVEVLLGLLNDDEILGHVIIGLGRLKAPRARSAIERYANYPVAWIRKAAKKAIAMIDQSSGRLH
jgi:HEAT repeat protein